MKRNLWPYGIILAFVLFISGTIGLIVMASTQREDLVSSNYYEQELRYQHRLENLERAAQSGASVVYDSTNRRLLVSLPSSQRGVAVTGLVQFYRPSEAGWDRAVPLSPDAEGRQALDSSQLQPGLWKVELHWSAGGQEYLVDRSFTNSSGGNAFHASH
jgi:nitrogen fixation protein FixH